MLPLIIKSEFSMLKMNAIVLFGLLLGVSFTAEACWVGNVEHWVLTWLAFTHQYLAATTIVVGLLYIFVKEKKLIAVSFGLSLIVATVLLQHYGYFAEAAQEQCVYSDGKNDFAVRSVAVALWLATYLFFSNTVDGIRKTFAKKNALRSTKTKEGQH